ncbi:MAG: hypothetical protein R3B40_18930 [Polyangiales bacterium]|nr:hypothetical protein [Myxococcales bacterium]MCB9657798.1 hypothetical protein [Sandaracinaceae bacterium]
MSAQSGAASSGAQVQGPRATPRTDAYLDDLRREFPRLRIVHKQDHAWSRRIDALLRAITFGGQAAYVSTYTTVLGCTIYLPSAWAERSDEARYITLRHEAVHLRQFRRFTVPGMTLIYGLPLFPVGLALGRALIEWEAYRETLAAYADVYGIEGARDPALHAHIRLQFTGPAYVFMWPFPRMVQRAIDREVAALEAHRQTPAAP